MSGELAGKGPIQPTIRSPIKLGKLVAASLGGALVAGAALALLFGEWVATGEHPHLWNLPSRELYDVIRASIGSLGLIGAGGAAAIAYRRQRTLENQHALETRRDQLAEAADQRAVRAAFHARFGSAAEQLGHSDAAIRLAGVYAMAQLADDWGDDDGAQRQVCVDVLCAYLRMPERQDPTGAVDDRDIRVREAICTVIRKRLALEEPRWTGIRYDLRGMTLTKGRYSLAWCRFISSSVELDDLVVKGDAVLRFHRAKFKQCWVGLNRMQINAGTVDFSEAEFRPDPDSTDPADRKKRNLRLRSVIVDGGRLDFRGARFLNDASTFMALRVEDAELDFGDCEIKCTSFDFGIKDFAGRLLTFEGAQRDPATVVSLDVEGSAAAQVRWGPLSNDVPDGV
ncbi:hypothetical protein [Kribbella ginsengisoli]|uniref:Pentapeptide repeat-containing protein n=1 Tax=Kribbella ginsengisoli TaxID=363865 RepID=A0ABP6X110_9ACTN